jgi:hypothetical protein
MTPKARVKDQAREMMSWKTNQTMSRKKKI